MTHQDDDGTLEQEEVHGAAGLGVVVGTNLALVCQGHYTASASAQHVTAVLRWVCRSVLEARASLSSVSSPSTVRSSSRILALPVVSTCSRSCVSHHEESHRSFFRHTYSFLCAVNFLLILEIGVLERNDLLGMRQIRLELGCNGP